MKDSRVLTLAVPLVTTTDDKGDPTLIVQTPMSHAYRVLVRNVSFGGNVLIAYEANEIAQSPAGSSRFVLPAGTSEVFVTAPGQKLYAASSAADAEISIAISEALPIDLQA